MVVGWLVPRDEKTNVLKVSPPKLKIQQPFFLFLEEEGSGAKLLDS